MIFDTVEHVSRYGHLGLSISRGIAWLRTFSPDAPDGRYEIDGDHLFALVQSYDTVAPSERKFESHRIYADIQYLVFGIEVIFYAPLRGLEPVSGYDNDNDFSLYSDPEYSTPLLLLPGSLAIFYPQDGHKPGCLNGARTRVKKVVIKARV